VIGKPTLRELIDDFSVLFKKGVEEDVHHCGEMQSTYSKKDSAECNGSEAVQGGFYVYSNSCNGRVLYFEAEMLQAVRQAVQPHQGLLCHSRVGKVTVLRQFGFAACVQHCKPVWQTMKNSS